MNRELLTERLAVNNLKLNVTETKCVCKLSRHKATLMRYSVCHMNVYGSRLDVVTEFKYLATVTKFCTDRQYDKRCSAVDTQLVRTNTLRM